MGDYYNHPSFFIYRSHIKVQWMLYKKILSLYARKIFAGTSIDFN